MRSLSYQFDEGGVLNGSVEIRARYTVDQSGDAMRGRGTRLELDREVNLLQPPIAWESTATRVTMIAPDQSLRGRTTSCPPSA